MDIHYNVKATCNGQGFDPWPRHCRLWSEVPVVRQQLAGLTGVRYRHPPCHAWVPAAARTDYTLSTSSSDVIGSVQLVVRPQCEKKRERRHVNRRSHMLDFSSHSCQVLVVLRNVLVFCIFHHAHIMDRNSCQSILSKAALGFGCVASVGAFMAGNCNPGYLMLLHYLGAAVSFVCLCFYCLLLTVLTNKCSLTGFENILYPIRVVSTLIQITVTICCILSGDHATAYIPDFRDFIAHVP
ncbi:hypothetical protein JZ751_004386 [Albula glossodonta]|uniref:CWH43-like N-terminal domain-containing protein n=1 Tax=Albula glossodonta TaxID=121402 RepID=A0A8T2NA58_9TELE|nr:hypothetical protein JZ751_004386 [Albula glossodonta]